jgi:hypothetical protein
MVRQTPTLLIGLGSLTFGAGLTAIVTDPTFTAIKALAMTAGVLLFLAGVAANTTAVRRKIPPLRTFPMRLLHLHQEGSAFDSELGAIPREQLQAPELWARLQDWDNRVSRVMQDELGESWVIYRSALGGLSPPGSSGWAEANRTLVQHRLSRISSLIHESRR